MTRDTIKQYFAVMNNAYASYTFDYFLDSLNRLGIEKIDLWGGVQHFNPYESTPQSLSAFLKQIRGRKMQIVAYTPELLAYPYNFASPDKEIRKKSIEYAIHNVDIAAHLETPIMLLSPGWGFLDVPYSDSLSWSVDSLRSVADYAMQKGIKLVLEHLTPQSSNLLTNAPAVQTLLKQIDNPNVGLVLDLGQMSVFGETIADYTDPMGDKLFHVHIMDGAPAGHLAFGDGVLPVEAYWHELVSWGYDGTFTLEINDCRYSERPHQALEKCIKAMLQWGGGS